ncbi:MAG: orotidine 5'-phosphate decarboxylase [Ignavibacteriales bacterium]|nr:orotidine 5'-phosphate decarboxylase [Ignavibacteriales bacterium]
MKKIVKLNRSVIPSCDVSSLSLLKTLVKETTNIKGTGAYKIGFQLALAFGFSKVIDAIRKYSSLPIIYDHQKAGNDIPEMGKRFAEACKDVNAVILFPFTGPTSEREWIRAVKNQELGIIVGGEMTHKNFLESEDGFIRYDAPDDIYSIAADEGVNNFVVPGNKPEKIMQYKLLLEKKGIKNPVFYSPGFITQGGNVTDAVKAAGTNYHAIVGRAIYEAKDIAKATEEIVKQLAFSK